MNKKLSDIEVLQKVIDISGNNGVAVRLIGLLSPSLRKAVFGEEMVCEGLVCDRCGTPEDGQSIRCVMCGRRYNRIPAWQCHGHRLADCETPQEMIEYYRKWFEEKENNK